MRFVTIALIAAPLILAACVSTPRQQCEAPYRAELRNVVADIRDTERTLARGFRLVPARFEVGLHYCLRPSGAVYLCRAEDGESMYDKRAINRRAELAKLAALKDEARELNAGIAACQARYPE